MTIDEGAWPAARLGNVARLRVMAAALPGVHLHERVVDVEFDRLWAFVSDLERTTPLFEPDVSSLRILRKDGDRWQVQARLPRWAAAAPLRLDVTMTDGWCWMVSCPQWYVIGIAADPAPGGGGTRLASMEGVAVPVAGWLRPILRPLLAASRWRHRLHVPRDLARLAARLDSAG